MQLSTTRSLRSMPTPSRYAPHYALLRAALRLGSRLSDGIALGFAHGFDSGLLLDYVYRHQPHGSTGLGQFLDTLFLNQPGWRAARARKLLLQDMLRSLLIARREQGYATHILDVASGPGRYNLELLCELGGEDIRLTCRDIDAVALAAGKRIAAELWLADTVCYERGDATDPEALATVSSPPDVVVVSGLYEILNDDAAICRSLMGIRAILPPGGTLLFTAQVYHPQLELVANVLTNHCGQPWVMGTRPLSRLERWAREAGFRHVSSTLEPNGCFSVTRCEVA